MAQPIRLESKRQVDELLDSVDHILIDCDGVIYLSNETVAGTPAVIKELRARGKKVIFASNNSSKSRKAVLKKLNSMGFEATLDEVIVSCYLVAVYLKNRNFTGQVYVFGCAGLKDELDEANIRNVGVGPDASTTIKDELVPELTLNEGQIDAVVVGFDSEISLAKLIKVTTSCDRRVTNHCHHRRVPMHRG